MAVYARSRVTAAHSVPVCTVETAQATLRIGPHDEVGFVCVFWHMRVAVCAGWGAMRGTGVDAHAVLFLRALQLWYALLSMVAFLSAERMVLWSGCYRSHATLKRDGS